MRAARLDRALLTPGGARTIASRRRDEREDEKRDYPAATHGTAARA